MTNGMGIVVSVNPQMACAWTSCVSCPVISGEKNW
jgi:hypothetical protein